MPAQPALLTNPFLEPMKRSFVGAVAIAGHTDGVLDAQKANPDIDPIYTLFTTVNASLASAYAARIAAAGTQKGKTASLTDLIAELRGPRIDDWDFAIQQVHRRGTSRYIELLPSGRKPFQEGRQSQRIAEVLALSDRIGAEAALATLKTEVDAFYQDLSTADATQEGAKGATEASSTAMEDAVLAAAIGLFRVYAGLVQLFAAEPERIGDYFNMELILDREQRAFTGAVGISATKAIAKRTLDGTALIRFVNTGAVRLRFYFAEEKTGEAPAGGGLALLPGGDQTVAVSTLGTGPYLNVTNESTEGEGAYELVIL